MRSKPTHSARPKSPAMLEDLLALKTRLAAAGHGGQRQLVEDFAAARGRSPATVYRWLKTDVGRDAGRKQRCDAGSTSLPDATLAVVASLKQEGIRANGKETMPTPVAMNIAAQNGLELTVGAAQLDRLLRQRHMQVGQVAGARNTVQMRSEHPNHVMQVDPSLCLLIYMNGRQRMLRDDELYKNKLDAVAKIKLKVWRYVAYDHFSSTIFVRYYEAAGENQQILFDFLMWCWQQQEGRLAYGLPRLLLWDKGSANTSRGLQNLCEALGVQHETHAAGHAWGKGGVEASNNIVETQFESRLRLEPVHSCEELNAAALAWQVAYNANAIEHVDSRVRRAGGALVRDNLWHSIRAEQLRICPPTSVCKWFLAGHAATRQVRDLRISFSHPEIGASRVYDLSPWAGQLYKGQTVQVEPMLLAGGQVRITVPKVGAEPLVLLVEPQNEFDAAGRPLAATVFGQRNAAPHDASVSTLKELGQLAHPSAGSLDDLEKAQRSGAKPFAHMNDGKGLVAHGHLKEIETVTRIPRRGQEADTPAIDALPADVAAALPSMQAAQAAPLSTTAAALRLAELLERKLERQEWQLLAQRYQQGVPAADLAALADELAGRLPQQLATGTHDASPVFTRFK